MPIALSSPQWEKDSSCDRKRKAFFPHYSTIPCACLAHSVEEIVLSPAFPPLDRVNVPTGAINRDEIFFPLSSRLPSSSRSSNPLVTRKRTPLAPDSPLLFPPIRIELRIGDLPYDVSRFAPRKGEDFPRKKRNPGRGSSPRPV